MNAATGWNARDGRFARLGRYAGRAGLLVIGLLVLTGCKNQQHEDQLTQLNTEIAQLQDEKSQLTAANSSLQTQLADARTKQAPANPQPPGGPSGTGDGQPPRDPPTTVIEVAGDVLFASGQASLKADAKKELDRVANTLKTRHAGNYFRVEGYTDTDPPNKMKKVYPTNEALSQARAEAVQNYLISKGISSSRISAVGMGSAKPRATKAQSRRVEIVVLGS